MSYFSAAIRKRMEKNVSEVEKTARGIKVKLEAVIDKYVYL